MYTITQLKTDLQGMLHGTSLSKVQGVDDLISRAARQLLLDIDPQETKRIEQIENALYDNVYDYILPDDTKGNKIVDIRPQANRDLSDSFQQMYSQEFDLLKTNQGYNVQFDKGVKTLRISKALTPGIIIHEMNSLTDNGTWAATASATNLVADTLFKLTGVGSLKFDMNGGSATGYIENSTLDAVDLSAHEDIGAEFLWIYIPDASIFTSINLRWGSSSLNYWNRTVTAPHYGTAWQNGWNLVRFDWNGATEVGTPDSTAVDYLRVTITLTGSTTETDFRVDSILSKLGSIYDINYYSKFLFRTSAGVWQETVTDDSNLVNLDTESYNILLDKCAEYSAQQISDDSSNNDILKFRTDYNDGVMRYTGQYKSEVDQPRQTYYRVR